MKLTNELLAHMSYSNVADKHAVRSQLEAEIADFLANGGEITPIAQPVYARKNATAKEIQKINDWVKAKRGRGGELCAELKMGGGFISQITRHVRGCSIKEYERICKAMNVVEAREVV